MTPTPGPQPPAGTPGGSPEPSRPDRVLPDRAGSRSREEEIAETFVAIADTLVDEFDVLDYMDTLAVRCRRLLDVDVAGLLLADPLGRPQVVAASTHEARLLDVLETQAGEGPCAECLRTGQVVVDVDGRADGLGGSDGAGRDRWPRFTRLRREQGFGSVYAIPLRLRSEVIGALNLFRSSPEALGRGDLELARGLADLAAIGLLQERAIRGRHLVAEQLQSALNTRLQIEQSKGVLAERYGLDMHVAFESIRRYARAHHQTITQVAGQILAGTLAGPITDAAPRTAG